MALVIRARIAGILSLCLLLSSFGASEALGSAAPPQTAAPQANAIVVGTGSCVGTNACTNAVGPIGDNSCNGTSACHNATGSIGDNSCNGVQACVDTTGNIGSRSCNETNGCLQHVGNIDDDSCNGGGNACSFGTGAIGDNSCHGFTSCSSATNVGDNSCRAYQACTQSSADIGSGSCNGYQICFNNASLVGDCANNTGTPAECVQPDAQIRLGSGSYVGDNLYYTDGFGQKVFNTGVLEQKLTFFIKIQNDGSALSDSFKVKRSAGFTNGYRVRYYDAANNDVTGQVTNGSFTTPVLQANGIGQYVMRATVKIKSWATLCSFTSRLITVSSVANSNARDAVRFTAARATPDLNCAPVAVNDKASITENEVAVLGSLLINDTDPDHDTLVFGGLTPATYASVGSNSSGNYSYQLFNALPAVDNLNDGDMLIEVLSYGISDGHGGVDTGTLTITIHGVTDPD